jgi:signal peptidase I
MLDSACVRESVKRDLALEALASFGEIHLSVQGASMIPALWPGDTLLVRRTDVNHVSPGDIVLCRWPGGLRIHRLLAKLETGGDTLLVTRGDALSENDPPAPASELLGRVSAVVSSRNHRVPRRQLSVGEALLALLARRSTWATRILLGARRMAAAVPAWRGCCLP